MRVILQRVNRASVSCEGELVSDIGQGVLALVGINREDEEADMEYCIGKILHAKLWKNEEGKSWKADVVDMNGGVLMVSQFTLGGVFEKGNSIDFRRAMETEAAQAMFARMVDAVKAQYRPERVGTGVFGGYMDVKLSNDGPVTIVVDSHYRKPKGPTAKQKEEAESRQKSAEMRELKAKVKQLEDEIGRLREGEREGGGS